MTEIETIRRAAALMREQAREATPGPWEVKTDHLDTVTGEGGDPYISAPLMEVVAGVYDIDSVNAEHIASWHPAVALAVADWLEALARAVERSGVAHHPEPASIHDAALVVARAYLGDTP